MIRMLSVDQRMLFRCSLCFAYRFADETVTLTGDYNRAKQIGVDSQIARYQH